MVQGWRAVALGLVFTAGSLGADDAVKLGRFQADPDGFGAMVKAAQRAEGPELPGENDMEQAFWGRRRFWNGFSAGYVAGAWGGGWAGGCSWGCYRPAVVTYYAPPVYYYYPRVVTYSSFYYGGWCGISGTTAPTQTLVLRAAPSAQPTARPVESQSVPQVEPKLIPPATDEPVTIPVSLPKANNKPAYKFPAYGEKK